LRLAEDEKLEVGEEFQGLALEVLDCLLEAVLEVAVLEGQSLQLRQLPPADLREDARQQVVVHDGQLPQVGEGALLEEVVQRLRGDLHLQEESFQSVAGEQAQAFGAHRGQPAVPEEELGELVLLVDQVGDCLVADLVGVCMGRWLQRERTSRLGMLRVLIHSFTPASERWFWPTLSEVRLCRVQFWKRAATSSFTSESSRSRIYRFENRPASTSKAL
jgi:hypothetical protein